MGACASVPKAMRTEADAPAPEPAKEETTVVAPEVTTVAVEDTKEEEVAEKKADEGDDKKKEENTVEVEALKEAGEVESEQSAAKAPAQSQVAEDK